MATAQVVKPQRDPARRAAILQAASRVFAHSGYAATSMEEVAAAAGVTKLIVYRHFEAKETLYRAVLERVFDRQVELFVENMAAGLEAGGEADAPVVIQRALGPDRRDALLEERTVQGPLLCGELHQGRLGEHVAPDVVVGSGHPDEGVENQIGLVGRDERDELVGGDLDQRRASLQRPGLPAVGALERQGGGRVEVPPLEAPTDDAGRPVFYCRDEDSVACEENVHKKCVRVGEFVEIQEVDCTAKGMVCSVTRECITCGPDTRRCQPCDGVGDGSGVDGSVAGV